MIRSITPALAKRRALYRKRVKSFLKAYPVCAVYGHLKATQTHHSRGRLGSLLLDERFWVPVSHPGHIFINNFPDAARKITWKGIPLLCSKGQWNTIPKIKR